MKQAEINDKFQQGFFLHQQGRLQEALDIYCEIIEKVPDHADAFYLCGVAYHQKGNYEIAVELILNAIQFNPENPKYYSTLLSAYNNLGLYYQEQGKVSKAMELFKNALDIDPDYPLALNNIGFIYQEKKNYVEAEKCYKKAIESDPFFYEAWVNLGKVFQDQQLFEEALLNYQKALELNPSSFQVYNNMGALFKDDGEFEEARKNLKKAIELNPEYPEALYNLGGVCQEEGETDEAMKYYQKCIELAPCYVQAYSNMGNVFLTKKMFDDAEACYLQAIEIEPDFAEAYNNVGNIYQNRNEFNRAFQYLSKATELAPDVPEFHLNFGITYQKFGSPTKASDCFLKAIELVPSYAEPYYNLGLVQNDFGRFADAALYFEKTLELKPDSEAAMDQLTYAYQRICQWDRASDCIEQVISLAKEALNNEEAVAVAPHNMLTRRDDPELCYQVAKSWSDDIATVVSMAQKNFTFSGKRMAREKIRVGYLSNTLRNHPGGQLVAGLFGEHNRDEFEIYAYSYGPDDKSYYRKKIESESDVFIDIRNLGDKDAATRIYQDEIDILVDLRGYTKNARNKICALRPAPVQVIYLGYPGTSGADFYDYLVADKIVVPDAHRQYFSENIVYMPDCYQVNNNEQPISEKVFTRNDQGLPEEGVVFCSFNTEYKNEPVMFGCWMAILKQVPGSVLWILGSGDEVIHNLSKEAEARGVDSCRLVFAEKMIKEEHLKRSQLADIALDTRIVNGHTTTSDALWAGLPVITMPGNHFASRVSASILKAAGLPELIVESLKAYEKLAVELALNQERLSNLKQKIEINRFKTPLFDTALFASNIEKAYKKMWDRFKNDIPHSLIVIEDK